MAIVVQKGTFGLYAQFKPRSVAILVRDTCTISGVLKYINKKILFNDVSNSLDPDQTLRWYQAAGQDLHFFLILHLSEILLAHSLKPGEMPSISASHQAPNYVQRS